MLKKFASLKKVLTFAIPLETNGGSNKIFDKTEILYKQKYRKQIKSRSVNSFIRVNKKASGSS